MKKRELAKRYIKQFLFVVASMMYFAIISDKIDASRLSVWIGITVVGGILFCIMYLFLEFIDVLQEGMIMAKFFLEIEIALFHIADKAIWLIILTVMGQLIKGVAFPIATSAYVLVVMLDILYFRPKTKKA